MLNSGIVRKIDNLGRIVIPKELRKVLGFDTGEPVEIYTEGEYVMLKKYEPACIFCGEAANVTWYKGKNICKSCIVELRK